MTDSIRDRIDRVIYDVWNLESGDEIPYLSPEAREALIDALLATFPVLAGVPDEMVEAGARVVLEAVIGKEQADEL